VGSKAISIAGTAIRCCLGQGAGRRVGSKAISIAGTAIRCCLGQGPEILHGPCRRCGRGDPLLRRPRARSTPWGGPAPQTFQSTRPPSQNRTLRPTQQRMRIKVAPFNLPLVVRPPEDISFRMKSLFFRINFFIFSKVFT
jgi:hypothetical protein